MGTEKRYEEVKLAIKKGTLKNKNYCSPQKALFIDRDNTINQDNGYTYKFRNFKFINNAFNALKYVSKKDIRIFIVTNQAGIGKGFFSEKDFNILHTRLKKYFLNNKITINDVKYSPFHPNAKILKYKKKTKLRKPGNLMVEQLLKSWVVDKKKSIMIGDSVKDRQCAEKSSLNFYYVKKDLKKQIQSIKYFSS